MQQSVSLWCSYIMGHSADMSERASNLLYHALVEARAASYMNLHPSVRLIKPGALQSIKLLNVRPSLDNEACVLPDAAHAASL